MVPRTVLTKSGLITLNTSRPVNTVQSRTSVNNVGPIKNIINNAYSTARRPFNKITTTNKSNFTKKVNIVKGTRVNTARPKAVLSAGNPQQDLRDKGVIDSGCSRHMTKNRSYLTDYEEIDGGFVAFGVSYKCVTRRNSVLFTDTACVVLSLDFKLTDENHVLLKVPRKDNMYSVDLKNVVPQGGLTCFFVKATLDESNLWHRRLGHVENLDLSFMRPFGCPVTILNTIDHLGKFDGKADEWFFVGYSTNSKSFRVFNNRTRIVEENLHVQFSENIPNIAGSRPNWLFDIDALTKSMNYKPVVAGNQSNGSAGTKACDDANKARMETVPSKDYILLPVWLADPLFSQSSKDSPDDGCKPLGEEEKKDAKDLGNEDSEVPSTEEPRVNQEKDENVSNTNNVNTASVNSTNTINTVSSTVNVAGIEVNVVDPKSSIELLDDPNMPELEDIVYSDDDEDVGAEADMNNLDEFMPVSPIPTTRIHKVHPIEATQEELLQFKLQQVWTLMDLPNGKRAIGTKWVFKNKKDERGIVIKNKSRLVVQGYTQEEGIDYDEVFDHVSRIEAIRLFLACVSFKDFMVYQMDVKSAFIYGQIEEEVYVCQPPGFENPDFPDKVYNIEKALYGLHQAPRAWYETLSTYLLDNGFQRRKIDKTVFIRRDKSDILLVQVYVDDIIFGSIKKSLCTEFRSDVKTASTPMETHKPLLKDTDGEDVDEHLYRSMIGSLMYLTSSRPDIMFAVCAYARFQLNPKSSYLYAVKKIFRYLKGQPKLGLWYPKDSPFDLVAYTDSDYAGARLDRKSTTGAEYIVASNCCRQVLWIQNQLLDYGYNFMQTKIYIDNESTICIVNNSVFHSKTKHIEIQRHFIKDSYENKLIQLMLLGINLLLLGKVNAARRKQRKDSEVSQPSGPTEPMADMTKNVESVPTHSNDLLLSGEDSPKLNELMELCTNLQKKVLDLETTKTIHALEIDSLKRREDASKQGRKILNIDANEDITLDSTHFDIDLDMFRVHDLHVSAATATTTTIDELILAQTLIEIKAAKPKVRWVMIQEPSETTTTTTTPAASKPSQDKGKAKND
ncbi:putative ribonuclease H-like domain-containing protein [Tanacetum coccineum]